MKKSEFDKANIFGQGGPNTAYAAYFVGRSYLKPVTLGASLHASNVTFEPGCRNNGHIHKAGKFCFAWRAKAGIKNGGKDAVSLRSGSVVEIPAGVKHWHGAHKTWRLCAKIRRVE